MAGQNDKRSDSDDGISENKEDPSEPEQSTDVNISQEYDHLDTKLDELNSALDFLEQKNDDIHLRLRELLQSNRDIREQMRNQTNIDNDIETVK